MHQLPWTIPRPGLPVWGTHQHPFQWSSCSAVPPMLQRFLWTPRSAVPSVLYQSPWPILQLGLSHVGNPPTPVPLVVLLHGAIGAVAVPVDAPQRCSVDVVPVAADNPAAWLVAPCGEHTNFLPSCRPAARRHRRYICPGHPAVWCRRCCTSPRRPSCSLGCPVWGPTNTRSSDLPTVRCHRVL